MIMSRFSRPVSGECSYWLSPVYLCRDCRQTLTAREVRSQLDAMKDPEDFVCCDCASFLQVDQSQLLRGDN